jgi:hypothetical protein
MTNIQDKKRSKKLSGSKRKAETEENPQEKEEESSDSEDGTSHVLDILMNCIHFFFCFPNFCGH